MQKLTVNLWMQGNADEAGEFYARALPEATTEIESRYPSEGLLEFQQPLAGKPLTVSLWVRGTKITLINAGQEFKPNPSISIILVFNTGQRESLDATWSALMEGGAALMPLDAYPFSTRYGWVNDKYGVSWQLMETSELVEPRASVIPSLMFGGAAQNRAAEAIEFYGQVLGAKLDSAVPYGEPTESATAEALMYAQFTLGADCVAAMDSGVPQDFSFTPGVSLEWPCDGQAEIDRVWDALSAVPEAEACGWLTDKFGVSWQIVPSNMGELMERPGAFENMLKMKKLVINDF
ncbi:putative 3-demethylubiquinone-9 3-methyltransferase (glyoxalase superfamily) [Glutamicibacter mysorens]|uniref:3-demethylubiquinone-9 3-methyltransferase (Glyoxalase superfamily) n=1 Tax=Glutamicibacter mysorens TaxID=257984 RepID=A0ABX4MWQ1_9MICC|nr:VOC family protein [Glutamicibacter mysorens]PJJ43985.1 putative 3-demethylubiquinone-9 3-methyltransferase (glyoxalase superfamily) [Glutamicibacter mysorens]